MYKALVRSHLDYCDIIYHIPSHQYQPPSGMSLNSLMEKVERIQYQAALVVTGTWSGSPRSKIYEKLGWESLSDRRTGRRVLQIHKIFNNKSPSYLKDYYHLILGVCLVVSLETPLGKYYVNQIDT